MNSTPKVKGVLRTSAQRAVIGLNKTTLKCAVTKLESPTFKRRDLLNQEYSEHSANSGLPPNVSRMLLVVKGGTLQTITFDHIQAPGGCARTSVLEGYVS